MVDNYKIYNIPNNIPIGIVSVLPLNLPRVNKSYLVGLIDSHIIHYPSPITLTYAWSFGSLAGICLVIQMLSGIFLAMHYTPHIDLAFSSVEYIMRDVNNGWLIRYIHANGASMFFIVVYAHICRGLYYGSYMKPRELLWCSGVVLFFLMMGTAFTGYVLPWGQMSFWGATVITSMVTAIPIAGQPIVQWLWGGYTVGNPTLNRFFSIHFFLPFLIAGVSIIHLALLHKEGSNTPIGFDTGIDDLPFYPYFAAKDVFAFFCFMLFFAIFVFYFPNVLNHNFGSVVELTNSKFVSPTETYLLASSPSKVLDNEISKNLNEFINICHQNNNSFQVDKKLINFLRSNENLLRLFHENSEYFSNKIMRDSEFVPLLTSELPALGLLDSNPKVFNLLMNKPHCLDNLLFSNTNFLRVLEEEKGLLKCYERILTEDIETFKHIQKQEFSKLKKLTSNYYELKVFISEYKQGLL